MPTKPLEIHEVASQLAAVGTEASTRSAISRAYYASLHCVAASFDERARLNDETSHGAIIGRVEAYKNQVPPQPGRTECVDILKNINRLRRDRNKADYFLDETLSTTDGTDAVVRSEHIMGLCAKVVGKRNA